MKAPFPPCAADARFRRFRHCACLLRAFPSSRTALCKLSGIGCSFQDADPFLSNSHGFNAVHTECHPSLLAPHTNRDLIYRGFRGRRLSLDRHGGSLHRHPPQREHGVHCDEQRLLLPDDERAEFRHRRYRFPSVKEEREPLSGTIDWSYLVPRTRRHLCRTKFSGDKTQLVP